jgi:hypothetical protein
MSRKDDLIEWIHQNGRRPSGCSSDPLEVSLHHTMSIIYHHTSQHDPKFKQWLDENYPSVESRKKRKLKIWQKYAEKKGGKCLSENYPNGTSDMTWMCEKGHIWDAPTSKIKYWCPVCRLIYWKKWAENLGGKCLSTKFSTYLVWQCREGHIWNMSINKIITWCPECKKIEKWKIYAENKGGKCLSKEISYKKLTWECCIGHIWNASIYKISKEWCPECEIKIFPELKEVVNEDNK